MQEFFLFQCYQKLLQEVIKKKSNIISGKMLLILGKRIKYRVFFYIGFVTCDPL